MTTDRDQAVQSAKPLSKTAQLKADRAARVEARNAARIEAKERLEQARNEAASVCRTIPQEFQEWGVVRTRAFMNMVEILHYRSQLLTIKADELFAYIRHLRSIPSMPLEQCHELADAKVNARLGQVEEMA